MQIWTLLISPKHPVNISVCRFSVEIWNETEKQINERFRTNIEKKYHNVIMGFNPTNHKNHEAINTIIMAVKKRICYKDRLKTHDLATIILTVVLLRELHFLPTIPLLGGGIPPREWY